MKIVKRILIIIITIILVLLLTFNIYNFISLKILKKDITTVNGYAILEVISGSMEPTINIGDLIVINTKEVNYEKGDIVTFYDVNGAFVTHRLINITEDEIRTRGDNNNTIDEIMPRENIVGKYVFKIDGLGTIITSLKNPIVSVMIFIIGILICIFISTDKFKHDLLDDEEEKEYQEFLNKKESKDIKKNKKQNKSNRRK